MTRLLVIGLIGLTLMLASCGSSPEPGTEAARKTLENVPDWYPNVPSDPNYLFAAVSATSKDMQLAVDKAKQEGRAELAAQLETKVEGLTKKFDQEVGLNEDAELMSMYTQVSKSVMSTMLNGSRLAKQEVVPENGIFRAFVLMELPWGEAQAALLSKIKAQKLLHTRFQEAQSFKELEEEVQKLEDYKSEQGY